MIAHQSHIIIINVNTFSFLPCFGTCSKQTLTLYGYGLAIINMPLILTILNIIVRFATWRWEKNVERNEYKYFAIYWKHWSKTICTHMSSLCYFAFFIVIQWNIFAFFSFSRIQTAREKKKQIAFILWMKSENWEWKY